MILITRPNFYKIIPKLSPFIDYTCKKWTFLFSNVNCPFPPAWFLRSSVRFSATHQLNEMVLIWEHAGTTSSTDSRTTSGSLSVQLRKTQSWCSWWTLLSTLRTHLRSVFSKWMKRSTTHSWKPRKSEEPSCDTSSAIQKILNTNRHLVSFTNTFEDKKTHKMNTNLKLQLTFFVVFPDVSELLLKTLEFPSFQNCTA